MRDFNEKGDVFSPTGRYEFMSGVISHNTTTSSRETAVTGEDRVRAKVQQKAPLSCLVDAASDCHEARLDGHLAGLAR